MTKIDSVSSAPSIASPDRKPVWDPSGSLASLGIDKTFVIGVANTLQTLICLSNLTHVEAEDAGKVRLYAKLTDEKLHALGEFMRPMLWNLGHEAATLQTMKDCEDEIKDYDKNKRS